MYSIEDVNSRTILQQFHALYENQKETNETVEDIQTDLAQEIQDRTNADLDLAEDIQSLQNQLDSLGTIFTLKGSVATVNDLPEDNNHVGDVYYVVSESTGYIWIDDNGTERWEQLGISVDLSNYVTNDDLSTALADYQPKLTAGTNVSIIGDTISATQPDTSKFEMLSGVSAPSSATVGAVGQKYLDTTKNDVYVCTSVTDNGDDTYSYTWLLEGGAGKQNKLTAGTNISINGDVISASGGMQNPMTTAGDIIYGGAGGDATSLPIGTAGQVLTVKSNGLAPEWATPSSSGDAVLLNTTTQTFQGTKALVLASGVLQFKQQSSSGNRRIDITPSTAKIYGQGYVSSRMYELCATETYGYLKLGGEDVSSNKTEARYEPHRIHFKPFGSNTTYYLSFPSKTGTFALKSDITDKVPDAPTTDGTYVLKAVVSSGVATYQWVLEE